MIIGTSRERAQALPPGKSAESGQIVWDKRRHWKVCEPILRCTVEPVLVTDCATRAYSSLHITTITDPISITLFSTAAGPAGGTKTLSQRP